MNAALLALLLLADATAVARRVLPDDAARYPDWEVPGDHLRVVGRLDRHTAHATALRLLHRRSDAVVLVIDSPGGGLESSVQLAATMLLLRHKAGVNITCLVSGTAGSAAFTVLQHCTRRLVAPNARLLQHRAAHGSGQSAAGRVAADRLVCALEAERIGVPTGAWLARVNAEVDVRGGARAVRLGLADAVVRPRWSRRAARAFLLDTLLQALALTD